MTMTRNAARITDERLNVKLGKKCPLFIMERAFLPGAYCLLATACGPRPRRKGVCLFPAV